MDTRKLRGICMGVLCGYKHRDIASQFDVSAATVSYIKNILLKEGYPIGLDSSKRIASLKDDELAVLIYPTTFVVDEDHKIVVGSPRVDTLLPDFEAIADFIMESHVTKRFCYIEYLENCEKQNLKSISKSDFYGKLHNILKRLKKADNVYMKQFHNYGYETCIDYCGQTWAYYHRNELLHAAIFVMCWSASNMVYARIVPGQTTKDTCESIGMAYQYFGYVPLVLQFDNGKSAVIHHTAGAETIFNESFFYYMDKLQVSAVSSNPRSPTWKSCVEEAVKLIESNILPMMTHDPYLSLDEANEVLLSLVDKHINKGEYKKSTEKTREYLFKTYEIPKSRRFEGDIPEFHTHIASLRVGNDYLVKINGANYSVPYQYAGEYVGADICGTRIKITKGLDVITKHTVSIDGSDQIKLEHMPEAHRAVARNRLLYPNKESVINDANAISPALLRFCTVMINKWGFENGKKGCIRLINTYKNKRYIPYFLDEAINRTLMSDPKDWNSNVVMKYYEEVQKEAAFNHGKVAHQTELNFCTDPEFCNLRHAEDPEPPQNLNEGEVVNSSDSGKAPHYITQEDDESLLD